MKLIDGLKYLARETFDFVCAFRAAILFQATWDDTLRVQANADAELERMRVYRDALAVEFEQRLDHFRGHMKPETTEFNANHKRRLDEIEEKYQRRIEEIRRSHEPYICETCRDKTADEKRAN